MKFHVDIHIWKPYIAHLTHFAVCLQKHYSAALSDHHPGEEISQSPEVPGGPAEYLRGSQSQVKAGSSDSQVFS